MTLERPTERFPLLKEMFRPPRVLFALGDPSILSAPAVAVVGTRRASSYGVRAAWTLASELSRHGITIVSGLAHGIDSAAHRGTLQQKGVTVAVLGHGLDRIYPAENRSLAEKIVAEGGCLLSEYPPGTPPLKHHFPERNRIISALSLGTVVVEAAEKSGSLLTARSALEQNREVFVLPGPFDDAGFRGSHRLIQEGAKLVMTALDILNEIQIGSLLTWQAGFTSNELKEVFAALGGAATLEELLRCQEEKLPVVLKRLEEAKNSGSVIEPYPQHFLWVQSHNPKE